MVQTHFIVFEDEVIELPTTETENKENESTTQEVQEVVPSEYQINVINHLDSIYIVCVLLVFAIGSVVGTLLGKQLWRGASV